MPNLNPPDFYLWGYLKDNVYENNPPTIPELKRTITVRIKRISVEKCVRVVDNFANHVHVCLRRRGGLSRTCTGKTMTQKLCGI